MVKMYEIILSPDAGYKIRFATSFIRLVYLIGNLDLAET